MNATESSERYSVSWWWTSPINESKSIQCSKTDQPITDKRRNPTTRSVSDLQRKLQDLNKSGNFSEEEYKKLQVSGPNSASFYGLPKFHNEEPQPDNDHFITDPSGVELRLPETKKQLHCCTYIPGI